ncbi:nucleotidyltransferase family protein [Smaragdicoccus niigatensis]|uniref:nucleotidyltransferase domain-containing protein n=1 Tax=Smaragdicoccus niigatensis TaxID=359359 RepID=UPI0012DC0FC4|nr:nucleotidyltransferase family protein [Smaragdicoccus niigatensis]
MPAELRNSRLVAVAQRHMVLPFLRHSIDRIDADDSTLNELRASGTSVVLLALNLIGVFAETYGLLADAGLRVLAVKGPALAVQAYGNTTARGVGDIDLLVSPDDFPTALDILSSAGWQPNPSEPLPSDSWVWRYRLATYYETTLERSGEAVDLHWRLSPLVGDLPVFDELWRQRVEVDLAGSSISTLGLEHALQHSCSHAARDEWAYLRSSLDIALLSQRSDRQPSGLNRRQRASLSVARALLVEPPERTAPSLRRALRLASVNQRDPDPRADRGYRPLSSFAKLIRRIQLGPSPKNVLRLVAAVIVPSDRLTGRENEGPVRGFLGAAGTLGIERMRRLPMRPANRDDSQRIEHNAQDLT